MKYIILVPYVDDHEREYVQRFEPYGPIAMRTTSIEGAKKFTFDEAVEAVQQRAAQLGRPTFSTVLKIVPVVEIQRTTSTWQIL